MNAQRKVQRQEDAAEWQETSREAGAEGTQVEKISRPYKALALALALDSHERHGRGRGAAQGWCSLVQAIPGHFSSLASLTRWPKASPASDNHVFWKCLASATPPESSVWATIGTGFELHTAQVAVLAHHQLSSTSRQSRLLRNGEMVDLWSMKPSYLDAVDTLELLRLEWTIAARFLTLQRTLKSDSQANLVKCCVCTATIINQACFNICVRVISCPRPQEPQIC